MASEIQADYASGNVLYAVVRNRTGRVWSVAGQTFEDWGISGHTAEDYDIALTDKGGSRYVGDFDLSIPAGSYCVQVFLRAGANPSDTDTFVQSRELMWTGSGELTTAKMLANRASQDKVTGSIDYYDDDGQTILLTHLPCDGATTLTRTPI